MKKKKNIFWNSAASFKVGVLLGINLVAIGLDQWTKWLVHTSFRVGESLDVWPPFFALTYVRNRGAAFGILQTVDASFREPFFVLIPVSAILAISVIYYKLEAKERLSALALSLVLAGAIGNLIDRLLYRYVIDFLDFHWYEVYHWPAFNVADSCIVVGLGFFILQSFRQKKVAPA